MRFASLNLPVVSKCLATPSQGLASLVLTPTYFSAHWVLSSEYVENLWTALHSLPCCDTFKLFNSTVGGTQLHHNRLHIPSIVWKQNLCPMLTCCFLPERTWETCYFVLPWCFCWFGFFHYEDLPMKKSRCSSMCSQQTLLKPWLL